MREAADALAARADRARKLSGHGGNLAGLTNRTRLAAAAGHAGLGDQLEVRRSPRQMHAPLADMDARLLRDVLGEAAPAVPAAPPSSTIAGQLGAIPALPAAPVATAKPDPAVRW